MREGERKHRPRARLRAALALLLGVLALPAFALGLGQIRVKSKPGQPLVAEIPIVTSDPTELQGLQARLASPETFRRIGLEPPEGIVSGLRFEPALDQDGKPVIRVTSAQPVQQAELRFLVEVDWGEGRLVREYSALVDPPRSLAAAAVPQVQAPEAGAAGTIQRPAAAAQSQPSTEAQAAAPAVAPVESRVDAANGNTETPATAVAMQAPAAPPAAVQPREPAAPAGDSVEHAVQAGETLSEIARGFPDTGGYSLNQTMLALLRANPEAFIGQDINRLRAGAVLRTPGREELSRYSAAQANAMVREQVANWRQSRRAQAQPAVADGGSRAATATDGPSKRAADARLEIAPPRSSTATSPLPRSRAWSRPPTTGRSATWSSAWCAVPVTACPTRTTCGRSTTCWRAPSSTTSTPARRPSRSSCSGSARTRATGGTTGGSPSWSTATSPSRSAR